MSHLTGKDRDNYLKHMLARLAKHYVRANRWMTWGQDVHWRREVIHRARLPERARLLDIGTGTGDLALEAELTDLRPQVVAADFTPEMMHVGRLREGSGQVNWVVNDALDLSFPSGYFDAVISAYLMRNVRDVQDALAEQHRVLKDGGRMVCLDTTPPPSDFWHLPVRWYLQQAVPIIGGLASGDFTDYRYLADTTMHFLSASDLADCMRKVGFRQVGFRCFMGDCMAIHWGVK